jgi:hypothetical protein
MTDQERFIAEIVRTAESLGFSEVVLLPYADDSPAEIAP